MRSKLTEKIKGFIVKFVGEYRSEHSRKTMWREPVVGFASASDPLFLKLRDLISGHSLPEDILENAKSVIAYFVPFQKEVVVSNVDGEWSSEEWARAYVETNKLIQELNRALSQFIEAQGYRVAVIPPTHNFDEERLVSKWSHKHVAYIAGIGKFGIHRMLITEKGCCGRLGSVITDLPLNTPSWNSRSKEYCLAKRGVKCLKCVERCKFGALTKKSIDRKRCYKICLLNAERHSKIGFADVCGKCACGVPCSFSIPGVY
jgi:epoxyqueuosine reductase QueG